VQVYGPREARVKRLVVLVAATLDATTLSTSTIAMLLVLSRSMQIKRVLNHVVSVVMVVEK